MANPAISSLSFIIGALFDLYALVVALRFVMQATGARADGPIVEFILRITNPLVAPLERLIPRFRQFNLAALLLCFLVLLIIPLPAMGLPAVVYFAFVSVISLIFNIFIFSIVILALLSWISPDPRSPIYEILNPIAYPILGRVRSKDFCRWCTGQCCIGNKSLQPERNFLYSQASATHIFSSNCSRETLL